MSPATPCSVWQCIRVVSSTNLSGRPLCLAHSLASENIFFDISSCLRQVPNCLLFMQRAVVPGGRQQFCTRHPEVNIQTGPHQRTQSADNELRHKSTQKYKLFPKIRGPSCWISLSVCLGVTATSIHSVQKLHVAASCSLNFSPVGAEEQREARRKASFIKPDFSMSSQATNCLLHTNSKSCVRSRDTRRFGKARRARMGLASARSNASFPVLPGSSCKSLCHLCRPAFGATFAFLAIPYLEKLWPA